MDYYYPTNLTRRGGIGIDSSNAVYFDKGVPGRRSTRTRQWCHAPSTCIPAAASPSVSRAELSWAMPGSPVNFRISTAGKFCRQKWKKIQWWISLTFAYKYFHKWSLLVSNKIQAYTVVLHYMYITSIYSVVGPLSDLKKRHQPCLANLANCQSTILPKKSAREQLIHYFVRYFFIMKCFRKRYSWYKTQTPPPKLWDRNVKNKPNPCALGSRRPSWWWAGAWTCTRPCCPVAGAGVQTWSSNLACKKQHRD